MEQDPWPEEEFVVIPPHLVTGSPGTRLSEQRARLWALVLDARALPCMLEHAGGTWRVLAPARLFDCAVHEVRLFEEENRSWPPRHPQVHHLTENTLATLSVLLLLATFHNITRLDLSVAGPPPDWISLGTVTPAAVRDGQWWRLVTALTLHADAVHLLSNVAIGGIFIICLCRELGSGLAWSLILGSGILGNLVNSLVQAPDHCSLGASTAVFGTVGILAAVSMIRSRVHTGRRRLLLPAAGAVALLALLGTEGRQTDLGAHLFGFVSGSGLGLGTSYLIHRYGLPQWRLNALLAILTALVVIWAWWVALGSAPA